MKTMMQPMMHVLSVANVILQRESVTRKRKAELHSDFRL